MRIWSKLCGPVVWPKMFINSFITCSRSADPRGARRESGKNPRPAAPGTLLRARPICRSIAALVQLHIEAEGSELLDEHVEGLRNPGFEVVVAADDRLVGLRPAGDVVRLHRQHLLQRV